MKLQSGTVVILIVVCSIMTMAESTPGIDDFFFPWIRAATTRAPTAATTPTTTTPTPTPTLTTPICIPENCFDCTKIKKDCTKVRQNCDSDEIFELRQRLCEKVKETEKLHGCDIPATSITIFPAAHFDESIPDWVRLNVDIRKDCCFNLSGLYYKTLSGIKIAENACVELYDGSNCTGESLRIDSSFPSEWREWIDCESRLNSGGAPFNDRTASLRLC